MKSMKGRLLVATPQLDDSTFGKTVLLMFEHSPAGAAGVILNRPTEANVSDIAEQVFDEPDDWDKTVHLGGPVPGPVMLLHTVEELGDQEVFPGVYNTVDAKKVKELVKRRPEPSLILANYAGWGPAQLEGEFAGGSWVSHTATLEWIFWESDRDLWDVLQRAIRSADWIDLLGVREIPNDPKMN